MVGGDKDGSDKSEGGKESGVSRGNEGEERGRAHFVCGCRKKKKRRQDCS